jgi:hypothetical protein
MADELDHYRQLLMDDRREAHALATEARAALAQPEPQGPTDEELHQLWLELYLFHDGPTSGDVAEIARAVLARWGRPAIEPVPVAERLPGPEDCDAEGRCWLLTVEDDYPQWRLHSIQGAQPGGAMIWVPVDNDNGAMVDCFYTSHWLPHHALPVPQQGE